MEVAPERKLAYLLGGFLEATNGVETPYYTETLKRYRKQYPGIKPRFFPGSPLYETPIEDIPF